MSRTLAQERSAFALAEVLKIQNNQTEFKSLVEGLPAMILQNGFGQALSFLLAKKKDYHLAVFDSIANWLKDRAILPTTDRGQVMREISTMGQQQYLQAQREAMFFLEWVKRYAKAFFETKTGG